MASATPPNNHETIPFPTLTTSPPSHVRALPDVSAAATTPTSPRSASASAPPATQTRRRMSSVASAASTRLRAASVKLIESDVPLGAWAAMGGEAGRAPSLADIRRGSYDSSERRPSVGDKGRRLSRVSSGFSGVGKRRKSGGIVEEEECVTAFGKTEDGGRRAKQNGEHVDAVEEEDKISAEDTSCIEPVPPIDDAEDEGNGYVPPPKLPWTTATVIGLKGFWKWFLTPLGFFVTIYALNVVAWGGMLFLLLCNAAPAMCHPTCNDLHSARRIWIEIDAQILTGLFCVTAFGLIPWRFRDLYWLLVYRIGLEGRSRRKRMVGLRRLAGIHRGWFRLPGSQQWRNEAGDERDEENEAVPLPLSKRLDPPPTGARAPPTATWRLDFVIWCNVWNTFFQVCLCGFMWGLTRFTRPSWATGLFVGLACVVAGVAGIEMFIEGKKVKKVEGVSPKAEQNDEEAIITRTHKETNKNEGQANEKEIAP